MIQKTTNHKSHPVYRLWCRIRERCYSKNCKDYARYGGRGITVCREWKENFQAFAEWALKNGFSPDLSIERIKVNKSYTPGNCCFTNAKGQARNRRNNTRITAFGETKTLIEWTEDERCTVNKWALSMRLRIQKLPPEIAITHPIQKRIKGGRRARIVVERRH